MKGKLALGEGVGGGTADMKNLVRGLLFRRGGGGIP